MHQPILTLDELRRAATNRKIPNADTLDFKHLLQALADQPKSLEAIPTILLKIRQIDKDKNPERFITLDKNRAESTSA